MEGYLNIIFSFVIGFMLCYIYFNKHKTINNEIKEEPKQNEEEKDELIKEHRKGWKKNLHTYLDPLKKEEILKEGRMKNTAKGKAERIKDNDKIILVKIGDDNYYFTSIYYVGLLFNVQKGIIEIKLKNNIPMQSSDGKNINIYYILKDKIDNKYINSFEPHNGDKIYIKTNIDVSHSDISSKYKMIYNNVVYYCKTYTEMASITKLRTSDIMNIFKNKENNYNIKIFLNDK